MQILYLISEEIGVILAVIPVLLSIIGIIASVNSEDGPKGKPKKRTILFAILGVFIVVTIAVTIIRFWMLDYCKVPDVVGLSKDEAIEVLSANNLNATYPVNVDGARTIVKQNPEKGTVHKKGTHVQLEIEIDDNTTDLQKGKIISFGSYEQDGIQSNGAERIEWIVLDIQEEKALLLSLYALDSQPYNVSYGPITWKDCTLRSWLKDSLYETAFTDEEKSLILMTEVDNSKSQNNREWNVYGSENTKDLIFLLSYADTSHYFKSQIDRVCEATSYAVSMGADTRTISDDVTDAVWWWLRSPGEDSGQASFVNFDGTRYTNAVGNEYLSVRPALWIDCKKYSSYIDSQ